MQLLLKRNSQMTESERVRDGVPVFVAEVRAYDARLQVFQGAQILDDVTAGVIEEQLAILGAADRDYPFEIIPIFEQIVDGLRHSPTRNYRDLWTGELFFSCLGIALIQPSGGKVTGATCPTLRTPRRLSQ